MKNLASTTRTQNAKPPTANGPSHEREYDERRARAKDYAATLGDALGWDEERGGGLVRVASHEDGLVAVERVAAGVWRWSTRRIRATVEVTCPHDELVQSDGTRRRATMRRSPQRSRLINAEP